MKKIRWTGLFVVALSFLYCEKQAKVMEKIAKDIDENISLESFANIDVDGEKGQVSWYQCKSGGQELIGATSYSKLMAAVGSESPQVDKAYDAVISFKKINQVEALAAIEGRHHCGKTVMFKFKSGAILVNSANNLDNIVGFSHKRKPLEGNWSAYFPK